jgi:hypothetical protein
MKRIIKKSLFIALGVLVSVSGISFSASAAELGEHCWDIKDATTQGLLAPLQMQVTSHGSVYSLIGIDKNSFLAANGSAANTPDGLVTVGIAVIQGSPAGDATIMAKLSPTTLSGSGSMHYYGQGIQKLILMNKVTCIAPLGQTN